MPEGEEVVSLEEDNGAAAASSLAGAAQADCEVDADYTIIGKGSDRVEAVEGRGCEQVAREGCNPPLPDPFDQSQKFPTTPDSAMLEELEGNRSDRVPNSVLDEELEKWADDINELNGDTWGSFW